jgi:hypothetical protein
MRRVGQALNRHNPINYDFVRRSRKIPGQEIAPAYELDLVLAGTVTSKGPRKRITRQLHAIRNLSLDAILLANWREE